MTRHFLTSLFVFQISSLVCQNDNENIINSTCSGSSFADMRQRGFACLKIFFLSIIQVFLFFFVITVQSPPRFVKQPPTDEVLFQVGVEENDKPFFIECEAAGEPAPT